MLSWSVLLLSVLLMTAATQDSEEQQKEEEEIYSSVVAGEGQPENVTVTPVGTNALNVSWDPPEEPPLYYVIRIDSDPIGNDTSNTYFLVEGLEPCQYYGIIVLSRYSEHQYPAKASGTTNTPEAPSPQSCWLSDVHTSTLNINWKDTEFKCRIFGHRIRWSWDVLWSDEESTNQTTTTTETQIHLDNFRPYTNVTASVEAESLAGYGQPTTCWNVTDQDIPGAPVITSITSYELSLYVSWSPPEEVNGELGDYEIIIVSEQDGSNDTVYTSDTEAVIGNLSQCEPYLIKLRAQTDAGSGPYSDTWNITHNVTVEPNFVECSQNESDISACWAPCSPVCLNSSDTLDLYTITWHGDVLWSSDADYSGSGSESWEEVPEVCYFLPGPYVPYTNYSLCVGVYGQVTATGCCWAQTPQDEPGPPVDLTVTSYDGSATVSWQPPHEVNGIISIYEVHYKSENHSKVVNVTGEDTEAVVDGLDVCENYTITVRAMTEVGYWGPESEPSTVTIDGTVAPSPVECSADVDGDVLVCWTPSPRYCPMDGYTVTWDGARLWTHNTDHVDGNSTEPWEDESQSCHLLESSVPYTAYNVCVSESGYDTVTDCCQQQTPEAPSSAPTNLTVVSLNSSQALISWALPHRLNGRLLGWNLLWTDDNGISNDDAFNSTDYLHMLDDLHPSSEYTVSLMAVNGMGAGAPAVVSLTTDALPNSVNHVGLIVGSSVGGALLLALVVAGSVFYATRRSSRNNKPIYASRDSLSTTESIMNKRKSKSYDLVDSGIQNYPLQRRASEAPGVVSKMNNYPVKRRASETSLGVGRMNNYPLQRRASEIPYPRVGKYPLQRRASEVPGQGSRMDNHLQRRKSEASITTDSRMMRYPDLRRSSEAFGRVNSGMQDYYGQRRSSEVPGGVYSRNNDLVRSSSESHSGISNARKNVPLQRRTSEVPGGINSETKNIPINRRASEMWGGVNNEIKQFHRQLRATAAPGGAAGGARGGASSGAPGGALGGASGGAPGGVPRGINNDANNYHGQRRATEMYAGIKPRLSNYPDHSRRSIY